MSVVHVVFHSRQCDNLNVPNPNATTGDTAGGGASRAMAARDGGTSKASALTYLGGCPVARWAWTIFHPAPFSRTAVNLAMSSLALPWTGDITVGASVATALLSVLAMSLSLVRISVA